MPHKESMSDIGWEEVRTKYGPRMLAAMSVLAVDLKENMPESNPSDAWEMDADNYWIIVSCKPEGREPFDISFRIQESQDFEGQAGGYTFSIDIVEEGGRILGGMSPYNYTDEVWCITRESIEERFSLLENGVDTIPAYLADEVL